MSAFDLDAALAEFEDKPLTYKGQVFTLPGELPGAVIAPFLDRDLGLVELFAEALDDAKDEDSVIDILFETLKKKPVLPLDLIDAAAKALRGLMGDDQYDAFTALRPSVNAYLLIAKGIATEYGVGFTDFFDSDEPADSVGESSKETSASTTTSTPEDSGDAQETPGSSE